MRGLRYGLVALLVGVAAATYGLATGRDATAAEYPTTRWSLQYGATQSSGTITWYNRSVAFSGAVKGYSGCKYVVLRGYDGSHGRRDLFVSPSSCTDGHAVPFSGSMSYDAPGGISYVNVELWGSGDTALDVSVCARNGCF